MAGNDLIKRILLYVDGSEECITAAQYAIALAKKLDLRKDRTVLEKNIEILRKAELFD